MSIKAVEVQTGDDLITALGELIGSVDHVHVDMSLPAPHQIHIDMDGPHGRCRHYAADAVVHVERG